MANKLFEKIESDALAAIDAIDAEYEKQKASYRNCPWTTDEVLAFQKLSVKLDSLVEDYKAGKFKSEHEYDVETWNLFISFGVSEDEFNHWQLWLDRDAYHEFLDRQDALDA